MALAVDATSTGKNSNLTSLTFSHTVSGSNRLLLVGVSFFRNTNSAISGITYNSVALTAVPSAATNNGNYFVAQYYLIAPATGTNNVVVSMSGSAPFDLACGATSFTDAHQTTPLGTAVPATGTSTSPSTTVSSASGELVLDTLIIVHSGTLSVGSGQTSRWNDISTAGHIKYAGSTEPGDASTVMAWSNTTSQTWAITAVPVKPTTAVSAGNSSNLLLLGAG